MSDNNENVNPWKPSNQPSHKLPLRNPQLSVKTPQPTDTKLREGTSVQPVGTKPVYPRHVVLSFNLRDWTVVIRGEVLEALLNVFPGTINLMEAGGSQIRYLIYTVKTLPTQPWPTTIAGIPYTVEDKEGKGTAFMFPLGKNGDMRFKICQDLDLKPSVPRTCGEFQKVAGRVTREFTSLFPEVKVVEFMLDATDRLRIILDDSVDLDSVLPTMPGKVGNIWAVYLYEKDLGRPALQAQRRKVQPDASTKTVDTSSYQTIRPGQWLISYTGEDNEYWSTTTGALVEDARGNKFMTAASHGVNSISGEVYSEVGHGAKPLGIAKVELSFQDVALVALENGANFENETFEYPKEGSIRLMSLLGEKEDEYIPRSGDFVTFDSPFTGLVDGCIMGRGWKMPYPETKAQHPTDAALKYIVYNWVWKQVDSLPGGTVVPDSTCGAPIVDEAGRVLGFFRYYIPKESGSNYAGLYCCVSAEGVVSSGYKLVKNT